MGGHAVVGDDDLPVDHPDVVDGVRGGPGRQCVGDRLCDDLDAAERLRVLLPLGLDEHVDVLVEHGLQAPVEGVVEDSAPVGLVLRRPQEGDDLRLVEQGAQALGHAERLVSHRRLHHRVRSAGDA